MKLKKIIGILILLIPFVALGVITVNQHGWIGLLKVYGSIIVIVSLVYTGVRILVDE